MYSGLLGPGTRVKYRGRDAVVEKWAGGQDYIVRVVENGEQRRIAVQSKELEVPPDEKSRSGVVTK